jgi:hypothetical protein
MLDAIQLVLSDISNKKEPSRVKIISRGINGLELKCG